jgi:hypothetical protein
MEHIAQNLLSKLPIVFMFNMLPFYIKAESDNPKKKFKALLQKYLRKNCFYSLDEYFELQVKF